jgi:hypothetical protein
MRKIILGLVCGVITFLAVTIIIDNYETRDVDVKLHLKCLFPSIELSYGNGSAGTIGTGVIVRSERHENHWHNVAITAAHVVSRNENYIIRVLQYGNDYQPIDADILPVKVLAAHPNYDIAILVFVSKRKMPTAELEMGDIFFGQPVFKIGGGANEPLRLDRGDIGLVGTEVVRSSAYTMLGDSGGPWFSKNYKVIALSRAIIYRQMPNGFPYFLFNMSIGTRVSLLKTWSEAESGKFDFVFKKTSLPNEFEELDKYESPTLLLLR